jgi:uncharacterized protein DUF1579
MRKFVAVAVVAVLTASAFGQEVPKPGPEHEMLKKREGTWVSSMKVGDMESKGTLTSKMELGGLWLVGSLESELFGQKFAGKSLDTYDPLKKKYVSLWVDSMSTSPITMEGSYDKEKKELTLTGEGPGMDGKTTKYKSITKMPDDDTIVMTMYMGDGKDPGFIVTYKRKK